MELEKDDVDCFGDFRVFIPGVVGTTWADSHFLQVHQAPGQRMG